MGFLKHKRDLDSLLDGQAINDKIALDLVTKHERNQSTRRTTSGERPKPLNGQTAKRRKHVAISDIYI